MKDLWDLWTGWAEYLLEALAELLYLIAGGFVLLFGLVYSILIFLFVLAILLLPIVAVILLIRLL